MKNTLYYGDNLDVLRRYIDDESIDLVYLDPPFNSAQNYNVLFQEHDGTKSASQIHAFEDTWQWDETASRAFYEIVEDGGQLSETMQAFQKVLGHSDMLAYLSMMASRVKELHRVLKPTGSIYLHCDSTASHYLKVLMDAAFCTKNFRNDIVWKRRVGSSSAVHTSRKFGDCYDCILFYVKSNDAKFNPQYSLDAKGYQEYLATRFNTIDENGRRCQLDNLGNPAPRPNLMYEYKGYKPPKNGWAISLEKMEQWDKEGRLYFPKDKNKRIRRKRFLDEVKGKPVQTIWDDIAEINSQAAERLGYPTQKPEALLERIINASSNEGDVVLDPFCGCGTAIAVAEKLKRKWIGIDITCLAVSLMKHRLHNAYGEKIKDTYEIIGEPVSGTDATELAKDDPYQFQWWALGLVNARPVQGKKGADKGIDGRIYFHDDADCGDVKQIIISVKAGKLHATYVRDLVGVITREKAAIGVLICMDEPTKPMKAEAACAGFYDSPWGTKHSKIQILTIEDLLNGKKIDAPPSRDMRTFKKAPKVKKKSTKQKEMFDGEDE